MLFTIFDLDGAHAHEMTFNRILIIRFGGAGDIIMTTPTVRALAAAFPEAKIDYVCGAEMMDAISGHPNVSQVLPFDKRDFSLESFGRFLVDLAYSGYDLVLNFHPSVKSALMARAAHPPKIVTFHKTVTPLGSDEVVHAIDDFGKELGQIGIDPLDDWRLDFAVPSEATERIDTHLRERGVPDDARILVINPAATRPVNRWPKERFAQLAAHFAADGMTVVVTGAARRLRSVIDGLDEEELAAYVAAADPRIVNLAGSITLKEMGALLQRAAGFVTCDTGPMHIGAAVGVPMVVLSGAADPLRTGPVNEAATVLIDHALPCVPCRARSCRIGGVPCMDRLALPGVVHAVELALVNTRRSTVGVPLPTVQAKDRLAGRARPDRRRPAIVG